MASVLKVNQLQTTGGAIYNNVVQVVTVSSTALSTGTGGTTLTSDPFTAAPTSTGGYTLLTTSFTPKFSTSKLLINTSPISLGENSNVTDDFRIFAHAGTTLLGWRTSGITLYSFSGGYNSTLGGFHLHTVANSWGTDTRTVRLAFDVSYGPNNPISNISINFQYIAGWANSPFMMTIMELQA